RCSTSSSPLSLFIVFVYSDLHHPYLHSFPTRRSSDLQFLRRQESQQSKLIINQKSNIMNTITKLVVLISLCLITGTSHAQDTLQKTKSQLKIESLQKYKQIITEEEKVSLKTEVETINQRLENKEITQ